MIGSRGFLNGAKVEPMKLRFPTEINRSLDNATVEIDGAVPATTSENVGVIKAAAYPYSRRPAPPKDLFLVSL
jgi:hypothetical protein